MIFTEPERYFEQFVGDEWAEIEIGPINFSPLPLGFDARQWDRIALGMFKLAFGVPSPRSDYSSLGDLSRLISDLEPHITGKLPRKQADAEIDGVAE